MARSGQAPGYDAVVTADLLAFGRIADRIESELRAVDTWQADPLPQDVIDAGGAFGTESMAFTQWLQFVLVPRLRQVAAGTFDVPRESSVHAQAVREFDGWHEAASLEDALLDLDRLVQTAR